MLVWFGSAFILLPSCDLVIASLQCITHFQDYVCVETNTVNIIVFVSMVTVAGSDSVTWWPSRYWWWTSSMSG